MKNILYIVLGLYSFDLLGFIAWAVSGQYPPNEYFIGFFTKLIINLF